MDKLRPPNMGWSSWNFFRQNINEQVILETANALINTNLNKLGYQYINIDDCWQSSTRNAKGQLQFDPSSFPSGFNLVKDIHKMELKIGLYSSSGCLTCEDLPGSYGREYIDAQTLIKNDIDFLKYDYCHIVDLTTDEAWLTESPFLSKIEFLSETNQQRIELLMTDGLLKGEAKFSTDSEFGDTYVKNIEKNRGSITFNKLNIPADDYIITFTYRKRMTEQRTIVDMTFNNSYNKVVHFPRSSGWSASGRVQVAYTITEPIHTLSLKNPVYDQTSDAILRYKTMNNAIKKAISDLNCQHKNFHFSICEHGRTAPWTWASTISQSYRIGPDIQNNWNSVVACYDQAMAVSDYAIEGVYADPDMLEVGNGKLSNAENIAHFSLWCFLSAPLILGNDIRLYEAGIFDDNSFEVISNQEVIHINQSRPFLPGKRIVAGNVDVIVKYLMDGSAGICFFNRSEKTTEFSFDLRDLPGKYHNIYFTYRGHSIKELWGNEHYELEETILKMTLSPHSVSVFSLSL